MKDPNRVYDLLLSRNNLDDFTDNRALRLIGILVDLSTDLRKKEGLEHAIELSEQLQCRGLAEDQLAISQYFLGNAWTGLRIVTERLPASWEQPDLEREVFHFRMALQNEGASGLGTRRVCQILTNLGSTMSQVGRPTEAIEYWNRALERSPRFFMARGHRGYGLYFYATSLHDAGHRTLMLKFAHADLAAALSPRGRRYLEGRADKIFERVKTDIEGYLTKEYLQADSELDAFSLGDSKEEIEYRPGASIVACS